MAHVRLIVGYDGTDFYGSQIQMGVRTVQGELERAIEQIGCGPARLAFAGRTDRGVHAIGQVASGRVHWSCSESALQSALNGVTPDDIVVVDARFVDEQFHARFSARTREYRYRIAESAVPPVLSRRYVWWRRQELDADRADRACRRLIGSHAFGAFAGSGKSRSLSSEELKRTVYHCSWTVADGERVAMPDVGRLHELRIVADGFLPQMVRNIVAAIVAVARGEQPLEWIDFVLGSNDRAVLGEPAPPHGLIFWGAGYEPPDNGEQNRPIDTGTQLGVSVI